MSQEVIAPVLALHAGAAGAQPGDEVAAALATALGSQYELRGLLGRGGMGAVYLAHERFIDRLVAVKVLPPDAAQGAESRERFLREAQTAARLTHPNIVPLHSFGQAGDMPFYVMGYVDGESLESRLARDGRLPPGDAVRILSELALALDHAHRQGVVHRDIKPDNVMLDRATGRAMLTDFGIAKQHGAGGETLTRTGTIVGTPFYMSPEQASGDRDIDGRSDLYSLGVIGYRMLAGRLPFEGSMQEVLVQHLTREPAPLAGMLPDLSPRLGAAVERALAKDPAKRWRDGQAMAAAVAERFDADESLPYEVQGAIGAGVRIALIAAGLLEGAFLLGIFSSLANGGIVAGAAIGTAIAGIATARPVRYLGRRRALQLLFQQPTWWKSWWPRAFRRPGDVWDLLPTWFRRVRGNFAIGNAGVLIQVNLMLFAVSRGIDGLGALMPYILAATVPPLALVIGTNIRAWQWARTQGMARAEFDRWLTEPTAGSRFWERSEVAARLATPAPARLLDRPKTPTEHVAAIERLASARAGHLHAPILTAAAEAARALAHSIGLCDRELAQLARDAVPAERVRIEASLAAMGADAADERDAKRRMRRLLQEQLELMGALDMRRADLAARRAHLAAQLQALWLQMANLRAQAALDSADESEITGRIRALCREAEHLAAALEEVGRIG